MKTCFIKRGLRVLSGGGVIAYPTEAVWGLGCDPENEEAVYRILALKGRPVDKGLILVAAEMAQFEPLLEGLSSEQINTLRSSWPGPNTWLLPDPGQLVPAWIKGQFDSVAVRVSAHPLVRELCLGFGGMLVSTSANPAGAPPAKTALKVRQYFNGLVDAIVPGALGDQQAPSTIRDLSSERIIRG